VQLKQVYNVKALAPNAYAYQDARTTVHIRRRQIFCRGTGTLTPRNTYLTYRGLGCQCTEPLAKYEAVPQVVQTASACECLILIYIKQDLADCSTGIRPPSKYPIKHGVFISMRSIIEPEDHATASLPFPLIPQASKFISPGKICQLRL